MGWALTRVASSYPTKRKNPGGAKGPSGVFPVGGSPGLEGAHAFGRGSFGAHLRGEFHRLPFTQGAESFHLDFGLVAEQVFAAVVRSDEPKTLGLIEPLDFASHLFPIGLRYPPCAFKPPGTALYVIVQGFWFG